jgi:hypothetical protein
MSPVFPNEKITMYVFAFSTMIDEDASYFMQKNLLSSYEVDLETNNYLNPDRLIHDEQLKSATT